ncbi:surface-adhesin E family protein [uncultured Neisseria sp.]|jgi:hypothetical protein|uniref:surface-adhesin E family protein n=1 Tax=uncultured Neisseria sp. TaxID=237778 RepID=UPI0025FB163D|nr:surface-adhesin E family protein [uncultured Neisseria sp.]
MKKMIFSAILMLGFAAQVGAANWVLIDGNSNIKVYADVDSRTYNRAWFEIRYTRPQKLYDSRYFMNLRQLVEFSCHAKTYRGLTMTWYTKTYAVLSTYTLPSYQIKDEYVIPGSIGENMYHFVCSNYSQ